MSRSKSRISLSRKKVEKQATKLTKKEKSFIISLYPKGRYQVSILKQLREVFPDTSEVLLNSKITNWIKKLHELGHLGIAPTESGEVVVLSKKGTEFARKKIKRLYKKDFNLFIDTVNRLMNDKDEWAVDLFKNIAKKMVNDNLHFYTIVFHPAPAREVINDLKEFFNIDFSSNIQLDNFKNVVKKMSSFGLLDVKESNNDSIIEATQIAKNLFAESFKEQKKKKKIKYKKSDRDEKEIMTDVLSSAMFSSCVTFLILFFMSMFYMLWVAALPFTGPILYYWYIKKK